MRFLIFGIIGIILAGFLSWLSHRSASNTGRLRPDKPMGGAVPLWVSLLYLASFASAIYGLVAIVFRISN